MFYDDKVSVGGHCCTLFFQYLSNNLKPQSICSPIRYTMYLRCVFWTGCRPDSHCSRAMTGAPRQHLSLTDRRLLPLIYIDHTSIHADRTSVGYGEMSKQTSDDYRPISISQLDLQCKGHRSNHGHGCPTSNQSKIVKEKHRKYIVYLIGEQYDSYSVQRIVETNGMRKNCGVCRIVSRNFNSSLAKRFTVNQVCRSSGKHMCIMIDDRTQLRWTLLSSPGPKLNCAAINSMSLLK